MYLLNSSNAPLREGDDVLKLIHHIDDLIICVDAWNAADIASFTRAIETPQVSHVVLLEGLMRLYRRAKEDQKTLINQKISLCAQKVRASVLPSFLSLETLPFSLVRRRKKETKYGRRVL